jgi:TolB-like protein/tetratricopeptide (TPR) repeat protein
LTNDPPQSDPNTQVSRRPVFLSYASDDAEAAARIAESLQAAGIEVWFDQSELRGGDAWDQSIRKQIKTCALFIPIISRNTHVRDEGYFRLEWKLAVDRSHLMVADRPFLVPVVIDDTSDQDEKVPDRFRDVQWTRLPAGQHAEGFVERVRRLLSPELPPASAVSGAAPSTREPVRSSRSSKPVLLAIVAILACVALAVVADRFLVSRHSGTTVGDTASQTLAEPAAPTFNPPPHSIAVLPFVNLSGDKSQEYFSDGLTEELLNSLAEIDGLQVAARTSAFSFKGQDNDIGTIGRKLNVGAVLEGSVRRSTHTVRITAQLINAVTGFHLWSKTYDRDLGDVLKLETEVATAVAGALKVTLLGDTAAKIELGGTHNAAAFDAYLRGAKAFSLRHGSKEILTAIAAYTEAIRLDPNYALSFAARSIALVTYVDESDITGTMRETFDKATADARQALKLAPDLAQAHLASGNVSEGTLAFTQASEAYQRALILAPGNAQVLRTSGSFAVLMGHVDEGLAAIRRAVVLDPLARASHTTLGSRLYTARRYEESLTSFTEALSIEPDFKMIYASRGLSFYGLGDLQNARASCEIKRDDWQSQWCLAVIYDKLKKHTDAEGELSKLKATLGDDGAYQYAGIYAQWGDNLKALEWLETALRLRDPGLVSLKTDPTMDPIRQEPRFQAVMRALKFPN